MAAKKKRVDIKDLILISAGLLIVIVAGWIIISNLGLAKLPVNNQAELNNTDNPIANWYPIQTAYWSFKIPPSWGSKVRCASKDEYIISELQRSEPSTTERPLSECSQNLYYLKIKRYSGNYQPSPQVTVLNSKDIYIDGIQTSLREEQLPSTGETPLYSTATRIYHNKVIYEITSSVFINSDTALSYLAEILSTFKFTN